MTVYSQLPSPGFLVINLQISTIYFVITHIELSQLYINNSINIFILCMWESTAQDTCLEFSL